MAPLFVLLLTARVNEGRALSLTCLLFMLLVCGGLAVMSHQGRDSAVGRDAAILAGVLAGMLVGLCAGGWLGASKWGWHSGETWYAVLFPALLGCATGPLLGGVLAAFFSRRPGRPRSLTGAVASGMALLISVGLALLFSQVRP
jgi:hypothetical protein